MESVYPVLRWFMTVTAVISFLAVTVPVNGLKTLSGGTQPAHDRVVVCYVAAWAYYRPGRGKFDIDNLDPSLCTHVVYAFAGLNITSNSLRSLDPFHDLEDGGGRNSYKKMTALRNRYPHLKVTVAIGGWNEGSTNYSIMAASETRRAEFIRSAVGFIRKYNFDGLDLDWEFPTKRGGAPEDRNNFVLLVRELREEFNKHGWLLTAALGAGKDTIDSAYDIVSLSRDLDYLHAMCYDYHGSWDRRSGVHAPLYPISQDDVLNVEYSIKYLLKLGTPSRKLIMGLPLYGRTFLVSESMEPNSLGDAASDKGFQGPYTREDGFMGYNEICDELTKNQSSWNMYWDNKTATPYAMQGNRIISYDDERSITEKVKLAMKLDLGGLMVWSIDTDDFQGDCHLINDGGNVVTANYPLMRTINTVVLEFRDEQQNEVDTPKSKDMDQPKKTPTPGAAAAHFVNPVIIVFTVGLIVHNYLKQWLL